MGTVVYGIPGCGRQMDAQTPLNLAPAAAKGFETGFKINDLQNLLNKWVGRCSVVYEKTNDGTNTFRLGPNHWVYPIHYA